MKFKVFLFTFFLWIGVSFSHDLYYHKSIAPKLCIKKSSVFPLSLVKECYDAQNQKQNLLLLESEALRARVISPPEKNNSRLGFQIERPFFIIDGIHLSTDEKRSLEDFEKEANTYGFPNTLKALGYTPVLIQFPHTVEKSIESNANALVSFMEFFANNQVFEWNNAHQDGFIVLGISQGGIIGRYASYLYDKARKNKGPQIKLFASLDSPHQGAVLPRGMLAGIDFWARGAQKAEAEEFLDLVSAPGAKDLIIYDTQMRSDKKPNSFEASFDKNRFLFGKYREAANYTEFPSVLISQGQLKGKSNPKPNGGSYYKLSRYAEKGGGVWGRAQSNASYSESSNSVFAENRIYETNNIDLSWSVKGETKLDLVQGTSFPFIETFYNSFRSAFIEAIPDRFTKSYGFFGILSLKFYGKWTDQVLNQKNSTFIPTTSALDLLCNGQISTSQNCAFNAKESDILWESPQKNSTAKAIYAVDKTHPRHSEENSGRHIEAPYKSDGSPLQNVIQGNQMDLWRLMCEVAKADYDKNNETFQNPFLMGQFHPEQSCLKPDKIPEVILNAGNEISENFKVARYDYAPQLNNTTQSVSFNLPAGWQKVALFDYGKDLPSNGIFEVVLKAENPKSNWLKADLLLFQRENGTHQLQLDEKSISPDGDYHTIRWQMPSSNTTLKNFRWLYLVLNSNGAKITIKSVRFIKSSVSSSVKATPIPFSKIYPNNQVFFVPWESTNQHQLNYQDNKGSGSRFVFNKAYEGVHWELDKTYDLSAYKNLKITYWTNTCSKSSVYIDNSQLKRVRLNNGTVQGNFSTSILPIESLVSTDAKAANHLTGYKFVLQSVMANEECIIKEISLEK